MARQIIAYHTTPVEAAGIAKEADMKLPVLTHDAPPLRNGLMRHMFMHGMREARGDKGDVMLGKDGFLVTLPAGSKDIETKQLLK